jgi:hypothetical protein
MAIVVWTNSQTSPYKQVALTTRSVVNYTTADIIESNSITKTPLTSNVANVGTTQVTNIFSQPVVALPGLSTVNYTAADAIESVSITKTPFRTTTPQVISTVTSGANSGSDIVLTVYQDEYWITQ